jgi:SAM-dependent methyltransferase
MNLYDRHARFYETFRGLVLTGRKALINSLQILPGQKVLEVGCGTGWNTPLLASKVGCSGLVVGVDLSAEMIRIANSKYSAANVRFICADSLRWNHGKWDRIVISYSLSAIGIIVLDLAVTRLKTNGRIGIIDYCLTGNSLADAAWTGFGKRFTCDFTLRPWEMIPIGMELVHFKRHHFGFGYSMILQKLVNKNERRNYAACSVHTWHSSNPDSSDRLLRKQAQQLKSPRPIKTR